MATRVPIADGLFTGPLDEPQLVGSRCADCDVVAFPAQDSCARCASEAMERTPLSRRGTLWTWTTQGFPPKSPPFAFSVDAETFEPYFVGYVELPGELRVESRLDVSDLSELAIGMEMELVAIPFRVDGHGNEVVIPAFRPVT